MNPANEISVNHFCNYDINNIITGSGDLRTYNGDIYIQDTTFYGKHYVSGKKIKVGYNITNQKPLGNVVIKQGAHVIFDAEKETFIDNGTEVEMNGKLEIRK